MFSILEWNKQEEVVNQSSLFRALNITKPRWPLQEKLSAEARGHQRQNRKRAGKREVFEQILLKQEVHCEVLSDEIKL